MPDQKPMWTRCLGGFSIMWVTNLLISPVKKRIFAQKWPNLAFLFIAGSFGALLVGWLVVVSRGLYLARHLFTLYYWSHPIAVQGRSAGEGGGDDGKNEGDVWSSAYEVRWKPNHWIRIIFFPCKILLLHSFQAQTSPKIGPSRCARNTL